MRQNVLDLDFESLVAKVEEDSARRDLRLAEAAKIDVSEKKGRSQSNTLNLSAQEKAILKALGLSIKATKSLMSGGSDA
jgi:hypothetical protein